MCAIWTGIELLAVCCVLLHRQIVAQIEESDDVVRASEFDNATLTWPVSEKESGGRLAIMNVSNKTIILFVSGFPRPTQDPHIAPAGDRITTFGFTFLNVSLSVAGEYRCLKEGKPCGRKILFVWGQPEKGRVIPDGNRLRCDVQLTSQPEEYRPPAANMVYSWYKAELLSPSGRLNNTLPDLGTRLPTAGPYITPSQADDGNYFSCSGKEQLFLPGPERSEWYQFTFDGPGPVLPGERNETSPNTTATDIDPILAIQPGTPVFVIIVSLVSLSSILLLAVIIAVAILCRRKKSTEVNQNATSNHQMAAKSHEQYSDEEDSTVLVDNTEYSDNNYFGSDSGLGEYSDIREIERLRIKDRGPAPLPQNENIYELQESVQVSDEHKAKLDNKDDEDEERIVTDIYAVPMKKGTLK